MKILLQCLLYALGAAAIAIALSIMVQGPAATLAGGKAVYDALAGQAAAPSPIWAAEMDSELRFYAALWGAYGILLILAARNLPARLHWVPGLAGVFFAGGIGRVISLAVVGAPHPFLIILMILELASPLLLLLCWFRLRSTLPAASSD